MNTHSPHAFLIVAALAAATASAQNLGITYVDADCSTNTTLADGTPYTPVASTANDGAWNLRAFANGGTILSSNDLSTAGEDCPMLRTTISGLIPGLEYNIYAYCWGVSGASWRLCAGVDTAVPASVPGYNSVHFSTSSFAPTQPLAWDSPIGASQTSIGLQYDNLSPLPTATGQLYPETTGHFEPAASVGLQEGNRWLYEIPLGTFAADPNGEIWVYVDDLANQSNYNRTWYDGVGYEWAPLRTGSGCGAPTPQIGFLGNPITNLDFSVTLSSAPASAPALLTIGFGATSWNGLPLPLDLGLFGYPGCYLNVDSLLNTFVLTDPNGEAAFTVNLVNLSSSPYALNLYWQWGALDPSGLSMTSGLETKFHR